jgi:hypothetical protein
MLMLLEYSVQAGKAAMELIVEGAPRANTWFVRWDLGWSDGNETQI